MSTRAFIMAAVLFGAAALCHGADFSHIERSLAWSKPTLTTNDFGTIRTLRVAPATDVFWQQWRTNKTAMRAAGYSARPSTNGWQALHWGGAK